MPTNYTASTTIIESMALFQTKKLNSHIKIFEPRRFGGVMGTRLCFGMTRSIIMPNLRRRNDVGLEDAEMLAQRRQI